MPAYRHNDWSQLVGALVEIQRNHATVDWGYVDDAMPDSSALWLQADGANGRRIILADEGCIVWIQPQELEGQLAYRMTTSVLFDEPNEVLAKKIRP